LKLSLKKKIDVSTLETVKEKYGVDLQNLTLNSFGKISFDEFVSRNISKNTIDVSISELDKEISKLSDPKSVKELSEKEKSHELFNHHYIQVHHSNQHLWLSQS
jgi:hypothetical protein